MLCASILLKKFNLPLLVLGGGGYTIKNVARCWAYETGILLEDELDDQLPYNEYLEYYSPDYRLHIEPSNMENLNTREYLDMHMTQLLENLRYMEGAPSVAMYERPPDTEVFPVVYEEKNPDIRVHESDLDKYIYNDNELYDPDDKLKERNEMNWQNTENTN